MRILVVEDDAGIAAGLRNNLQQRGYAVDICSSVAAAWSALRSERFDAVLLDLGLPDGDGGELLTRLRGAPEAPPGAQPLRLPDPATPVLILTARDQVHQRIAGLDQGADDYLAKPFDVDELEARLRALLRRAAGRASPVIRVHDIELDPAARTVRRAGQLVEMSPREFSVLLVLLDAREIGHADEGGPHHQEHAQRPEQQAPGERGNMGGSQCRGGHGCGHSQGTK